MHRVRVQARRCPWLPPLFPPLSQRCIRLPVKLLRIALKARASKKYSLPDQFSLRSFPTPPSTLLARSRNQRQQHRHPSKLHRCRMQPLRAYLQGTTLPKASALPHRHNTRWNENRLRTPAHHFPPCLRFLNGLQRTRRPRAFRQGAILCSLARRSFRRVVLKIFLRGTAGNLLKLRSVTRVETFS